jgi:5-methylcytosine-specific restriction enzyme A
MGLSSFPLGLLSLNLIIMTEWIEIKKDPVHVSKEKSKANALKKTQWWKNEIARGICHYCGGHFKASELTMDHIVPVSRGGKSSKGNVVPCCKKCNAEKKYLTPVEIKLRELEIKKQSDKETK